MPKIINTTKIAALIAFGAFCAMIAFGLLFAVATNPAHALDRRILTPPPPNPVTVKMQQARTKKYDDFHKCLGARFHEPDVLADTAKFEQANKDAGFAAAERNLTKFNAQVDLMDVELERMNPNYGC